MRNVQPLIDGDILAYQAAFGGQDRETGEPLPFSLVGDLVERYIAEICDAVEATTEPIVYLTGSRNFRNEISVTKPYKGTRGEKPFHLPNVRAYLQSLPYTVTTDGIEADDAMSIEQCSRINEGDTVICSRDKDLRMIPGFHYGWEHYLQPEFPKQWIDSLGYLKYNEEKKKLSGGGYLFFCSQLITGDTVDNIPGLPKKGPKAAYALLKDKKSEEEAMTAVVDLYKEVIGEDWREYLLEQGRLLWMVREVDENNLPIMWEIPFNL